MQHARTTDFRTGPTRTAGELARRSRADRLRGGGQAVGDGGRPSQRYLAGTGPGTGAAGGLSRLAVRRWRGGTLHAGADPGAVVDAAAGRVAARAAASGGRAQHRCIRRMPADMGAVPVSRPAPAVSQDAMQRPPARWPFVCPRPADTYSIRTPAPRRPGSAPLIYVNVNVIQSIRPDPGAQPARWQPSRHRTAPAHAAVAAKTRHGGDNDRPFRCP
ncbi:protein of unknown function [Cupriavidus taiwanensis]|uniref:Uncharacterized protein n=1 Tax=Cupriavidus taiwanensis TaxID=164546 RepID=A0A375IKH3_9BURK|nr:hypothetical protein CBM2588_A40006 [Cupriavidus taiwanensis]SOY54839.1 hypothetical protein CBM2592_A60002 [Cupriavidus taiwanensis]SOY87953.1 hypothetical protein CBM2591_A50002 [Cupriavidus taiwanensis]SOZ24626.1 hypothetical protein CBM2608_A40002 [Cupriavidus taiwanensis]SOZ61205.1 hypothetical protein CBM2617_A40003 [Cupriavidus taiwanensis]